MKYIIDKTKKLLNIPDDYKIAVVPGSDTGAMETSIWNLLGQRCVDVYVWEAFGKKWYEDILKLKLNHNIYKEDYGKITDLSNIYNKENDTIFVYNSTTSGVKVPNTDWISNTRTGITICDATSAVFCYDLDWSKLDVTTFSWQKSLGCEAGLGMIVISPAALRRLESHTPIWPIPDLFSLKDFNNKINDKVFSGHVINTPSMLCIEDYVSALDWLDINGGIRYSIKCCEENFKVINEYVSNNPDLLQFLVLDENIRSVCNVSLVTCLQDISTHVLITDLVNSNEACDIESYIDAPYGIRIWCGPTVTSASLDKLMYTIIKRIKLKN